MVVVAALSWLHARREYTDGVESARDRCNVLIL